MALIEVKCPNCGANLVEDNNKEQISCKYCHTKFTIKNDSSFASEDSPMLKSDVENKELLERAETFLLKLAKYDTALEMYQKYSMLEPSDYRGWWGIASALSENFTKTSCDKATMQRISENVELALKVSGDNRNELEKTWNEFKENTNCTRSLSDMSFKRNITKFFEHSKKIQILTNKLTDINKELELKTYELQLAESEYTLLLSRIKKSSWISRLLTIIKVIPIYQYWRKRSKIKNLKKRINLLLESKKKLENEINNAK